jgi:HD-GYP domain-containing protein (c-di-GMP phosphodiesterase class II)
MKSMGVEQAIRSLHRRAGSKYDPSVVEALERVIGSGALRLGI